MACSVSAEDKKAVQEQVSEEFAGVQQMLTADMFSNPFEEMFMTDEQRAEKAKEKKHPWMIDSENDLTMTVKFSGNDLTFNDDKYTLAEFLTKMKMMPGAEDEMGYEEEAQPADGAEVAEPAIEAEQPAEAPAAQ